MHFDFSATSVSLFALFASRWRFFDANDVIVDDFAVFEVVALLV